MWSTFWKEHDMIIVIELEVEGRRWRFTDEEEAWQAYVRAIRAGFKATAERVKTHGD
jgi:hypothetical protein